MIKKVHQSFASTEVGGDYRETNNEPKLPHGEGLRRNEAIIRTASHPTLLPMENSLRDETKDGCVRD